VKYLVDADVLSEATKPAPAQRVGNHLTYSELSQMRNECFLAAKVNLTWIHGGKK
jgi:hypothetical protein